MKKLRVLLVDDEIMIREGFKRLFDWAAHDCEVVGEAADGMEALAQIDALQPDIAIMDINIPILNGLKVIQRSRVNHPASSSSPAMTTSPTAARRCASRSPTTSSSPWITRNSATASTT